jgi:holliday junction resolvase YEN1
MDSETRILIMISSSSSNTLSGNQANPIKNSAGKDDKNHTIVYCSEDISTQFDIGLTRGGLILIGILSGGDYHQAGLPRCGIKIAHALAKCGFGDSLYHGALTYSRPELLSFLKDWRDDLRQELRSNSQGHLRGKNVALAKCVPEDFPDIDILLSYANPITSETEGRTKHHHAVTWDKEPDLKKLANICELYFEWGVKPLIIKRFRTVIWPPFILRILRRAVVDADRSACNAVPSTPKKKRDIAKTGSPSKSVMDRFSSIRISSPSGGDSDEDDGNNDSNRLIVKIHSTRTHASTDGILEYRLEIAPAYLVHLCEAGIAGIRPPIINDEWTDDDGDEDGGKKLPSDPLSSVRMWMPASLVRLAEPGLVSDFEAAQAKKQQKKKATSAGSKKLAPTTKAPKTKIPCDTAKGSSGHEDCPTKIIVGKTGAVRRRKVHAISTKPSQENASSGDDDQPQSKPAVAKNLKSFFTVGKEIKHRSNPLAVKTKGNASSRPVVMNSPQDRATIESSDTEDSPTIDSSRESSIALTPVKAFTTTLQSSTVRDIFTLDSENEGDIRSSVGSPKETRPSIPASRHTRKAIQLTSESDSYQESLKKSPRKSARHISPRFIGSLRGTSTEEDEHDCANPRVYSVSPSPSRSRVKILNSEPVIEISSDSDALPSKLNFQPLLVARARKANSKLTLSSSHTESGKAKESAWSPNVKDVIDLTI